MNKRGWWAAGFAVAGLGLVGAIYGYWKPLVQSLTEKSQTELQAWMSRAVGAPVEIGAIEVHWDWLFPEISLSNVRTEFLSIDVKRISLKLHVRESLSSRQLRFGRVVIEGFQGAYDEKLHGERVERLFASESGPGANDVLGFASQFEMDWVDPKFRMNRLKSGALTVTARWWNTKFRAGSIDTRARDAVLDVPQWWSRATSISQLQFNIHRREGEWYAVETDVVTQEKIRLLGRGDLNLRTFHWKGELDVHMKTLVEFLPLIPKPWIHPDTRVWVENHLEGTELQRTRVTLKHEGNGTEYHVQSELKIPEFEFAEGWPKILGTHAILDLSPTELQAKLNGGSVAGVAVSEVVLRSKAPFHQMRVETGFQLNDSEKPNQDAESVRAFLTQTPLESSVKTVFQSMRLGPKKKFDLALDIDLEAEEPVVTGNVEVHEAMLQSTTLPVAFEAIKGKLEWDAEKLSLKNISATLDKLPVAASGFIQLGGKNGGDARLSGRATVSTARMKSSLNRPLSFLEGQIPIEWTWTLQKGVHLCEVTTETTGATLDLPNPLKKDASWKWPLKANVRIQNERLTSGEMTLRSEVGDRDPMRGFQLAMTLRTDPSGNPQWTVKGAMGETPIAAWQSWWNSGGQMEIETTTQPNSTASPEKAQVPAIDAIELYFNRLVGSQYQWPELRLHVRESEAVWDLKLQSPDLEGSLAIPKKSENGWVRARFSKLTLPEFPKPSPDASTTPLLKPRGPSYDLVVDRMRVGPQLFGSVTAKLHRDGSKYLLEKGEVHGPELDLVMEHGSVFFLDQGSQSSLSGTLQVKSSLFPTRFERLKAIELGPSSFYFDLKWPEGPEAFSLKNLDGKIKGTAKHGVFRGIESGAAAAFNFLSYSGDDTEQKILRFQKAGVDLKFSKGEARFQLFRALVGSVFTKVSGTASTLGETYDLEARVTPLQDDYDEKGEEPGNLLSHTYTITGSWARPSVKLKIF